jgi:hypothetical protein
VERSSAGKEGAGEDRRFCLIFLVGQDALQSLPIDSMPIFLTIGFQILVGYLGRSSFRIVHLHPLALKNVALPGAPLSQLDIWVALVG